MDQSKRLVPRIVKSPRSTGFTKADEDIPYLSIASARSESQDSLMRSMLQTQSNPEDVSTAFDSPRDFERQQERKTSVLSGEEAVSSPRSGRSRGSFLLSSSAHLDDRALDFEPEDEHARSAAEKVRMELGELVISVLQNHDEMDESKHDSNYGVFESFFDLTRPRLKYIFHTLDQLSTAKAAGIVDYDHLKKGLLDAGIVVRDDASFNKLVHLVDQDLDGGITFNEFETIIQSIKMAHLFREREKSPTGIPPFRCLNYNVAKCDSKIITEKDITEFMYSPRQEVYPQRWVHITTPAPFTLKALSIKYRIHPLAVEDALVNDPHIRAKVDSYDNHLFVVIPVFSISVPSSSDQELPKEENELLVSKYGTVGTSKRGARFRRTKAEYSNLGSDDETEVSKAKSLKWRKSTSPRVNLNNKYRTPKLKKHNAFIYVSRPVLNTTISVVDEKTGDIFRRARRELNVSYSRLRAYDSIYLMYTLLDEIVDSYAPILAEFEKALIQVRSIVREKPKSFFQPNDTSTQELYHDLIREVTMLKRWVVPVQRVLSHLLEEETVDPDCKVYLRDVQDHLLEVLDDVLTLLDSCRALKEEHMQMIESKMTSTMNGLTIVATTFLPGQFLTGVFGMNFEDMPELHWRYGYPLFWIICIFSWIAIFGFFKSRNYI